MLSSSTSSWKTKNQISAPWYSPHSMLINAPRNMSSKWEIALNEKHQNTNQYAPSMILSHSTLESERSITRDTLEFHITYKWIGNQMPIINTYIQAESIYTFILFCNHLKLKPKKDIIIIILIINNNSNNNNNNGKLSPIQSLHFLIFFVTFSDFKSNKTEYPIMETFKSRTERNTQNKGGAESLTT
jgi:hypothetical protein